jgi:hypothetical protein
MNWNEHGAHLTSRNLVLIKILRNNLIHVFCLMYKARGRCTVGMGTVRYTEPKFF